MKRRAESCPSFGGRELGLALALGFACAAGCTFDTAGPGRMGGGDGMASDAEGRDSLVYSDGGFIVRDLSWSDGASSDGVAPRNDLLPSIDGGALLDFGADGAVDQGLLLDGPAACPVCPLGCDESGVCHDFDLSNMPATTFYLSGAAVAVPEGGRVVVSTDALTFASSEGVPIELPKGTALLDLGDVVVFAVGAMEVAQDAVLRVEGSKPFAVVAWGEIVVKGRIDVSGARSRPGAGGGQGGVVGSAGSIGYGAGNCTGGASGVASGSESATGGGGGGFGGEGGEGGGGSAGGASCGTATLRPLVGGTGGGGGARTGGAGGGGGGAIQLSSGTRIVVDGLIKAGGGAGRGGRAGSGGGGGSGGGILLEAPRVTVNGALFAEGGGGGGASNDLFGGASGEDARDDGRRADGGDGGGAIWIGGHGGRGSGQNELAGEAGSYSENRGGGGGGAAGRIVLRSLAGTAGGVGAVSPLALQEQIVVQ